MSTWSEAPVRSSVLRGGAANGARAARLDSDLRTTAFASAHVVDARLTDPHLEAVVAQAVETATAAGRAAGWAEGYAAGQAQAASEAVLAAQERATREAAAEAAREARAAAAADLMGQVTQALRAQEAVAVAEVEDVVVELALRIARSVLDRELAVSADPGGEALARALALAPDGAPVVARLHPLDAEALSDEHRVCPGRTLEVVPDPAVEPGGCVLETAGRRIDAQVGPALERVAAVLR